MSTKTPLDDLTDKQQAFVREYTAMGQGRGTREEACRRAGYEGDNLDVVAWDLMRKPKIIAACRYLLEVRLMEKAPEMLNVVYDLATDDRVDFKGQAITASGVRLQAANTLLDRAGLAPVTKSEQKIEVNDNRPTTLLEYNQRLALALQAVKSLPPEQQKLLESRLAPVEAEFEEVVDLDRPI